MSREVADFFALLNPTPKQVAFLKALRVYRYILYGGARGGGKSRILRWALLWLLLDWYQRLGLTGVRVALFCEDYPSLKDRQISKIQKEFPEWLGELKETKADGLGFHLKPEYGGGAILLRNLDDASKYMSAEFAAIAVDELTKHQKETFDYLRGSLRWPGIGHTLFLGATNPGGPGHLWVKQLFVDGDFPEELKPLAHRFHFIRSLPADNPHLDAEYWAELNSLPEGLRKAWVEGLWDVFLGQAFPGWQPAVHILRQPAPEDWRLVAGMDWGIASPGWFGLAAEGPRDRLHLRHEFAFGQGTKQGRMLPYDVGYAIGTKCSRSWGTPEFIVLDNAAWQEKHNGMTVKVVSEEMQRGLNDAYGGNPLRAPQLVKSSKKSGTSRASRMTLMHAALDWKPNKINTPAGPVVAPGDAAWKNLPPWAMPRLTVHPDCEYFIETVPALPVEEGDPSKVDTEAPDHAFDGLTYLLERLHHIPVDDSDRQDSPDRHPGFTEQQLRKKVLRLGDRVEEDSSTQHTGFWSPWDDEDDSDDPPNLAGYL